MSKNTILGGPPSTTESTTDEGPDGPPSDDGQPDDASAELDRFVRMGDAETAIHRSRLFELLAFALERPDEEFEAALRDGAFGEPLVASAAAIDPDVAEAARRVGERTADRGTLKSDWASLFGVEEGLNVSPYQLTYLPGPLMTNVRRLADIRGFYEAFGLSFADGENDRGDHICFLAEFAAHLSEREAYARRTGNEEMLAVVVDAQRSFLEDHLGRWYWRFADEVSKRDDRGFYAAVAGLLAALVEHEVDRLELDPDWVPDDPAVTEWNEDVFGDSGRGCGGCGSDAEGLDDHMPMDVPSGPPEEGGAADPMMDLASSPEDPTDLGPGDADGS